MIFGELIILFKWSAEGHFRGQRSGLTPFDNFIIYPLSPFTHPLSSSPSVDLDFTRCSFSPGPISSCQKRVLGLYLGVLYRYPDYPLYVYHLDRCDIRSFSDMVSDFMNSEEGQEKETEELLEVSDAVSVHQ